LKLTGCRVFGTPTTIMAKASKQNARRPAKKSTRGKGGKKPTRKKPAAKSTPQKKAGRKPKYASAAAMQKKIDAYFKTCEARTVHITAEDGTPIEVSQPDIPTKSGLRKALDMSEQLMSKYRQGKMGEQFVEPITRAETHIQTEVLRYGFFGKNHRFAQWYLGVAFGMVEVQKHEHGGDGGGPVKHVVEVRYGKGKPGA